MLRARQTVWNDEMSTSLNRAGRTLSLSFINQLQINVDTIYTKFKKGNILEKQYHNNNKKKSMKLPRTAFVLSINRYIWRKAFRESFKYFFEICNVVGNVGVSKANKNRDVICECPLL